MKNTEEEIAPSKQENDPNFTFQYLYLKRANKQDNWDIQTVKMNLNLNTINICVFGMRCNELFLFGSDKNKIEVYEKTFAIENTQSG